MIFEKISYFLILKTKKKKKKKRKKTWLKGEIKAFSVDYDPINISDIIDFHRFLIGET